MELQYEIQSYISIDWHGDFTRVIRISVSNRSLTACPRFWVGKKNI